MAANASGVSRLEVAPRSSWMNTRCASPKSNAGRARPDTLAPRLARNCASRRIAWRTLASVSAVGCDSITATRQPRSVLRCGLGSASFQPAPSIASGPAMMENASSRSVALRASGPIARNVGRMRAAGQGVTGHRADAPGRLVAVDAAVVRRIADRAADVAAGVEAGEPAARAAAEPPEEPPGVRSWFHGFTVLPYTGLTVSQSASSVGTFDLPNTLPPARRKRSTASASLAAGVLQYSARPQVVGSPATSKDSFTVSGSPASGPRLAPLRSNARARLRAASRSSTGSAFSASSWRSMRAA